MWDHHSWEMPEVMNEARTSWRIQHRDGLERQAESKGGKMQILQFDTRLEKRDTELLWQGKEEGKKMGKEKNSSNHRWFPIVDVII